MSPIWLSRLPHPHPHSQRQRWNQLQSLLNHRPQPRSNLIGDKKTSLLWMTIMVGVFGIRSMDSGNGIRPIATRCRSRKHCPRTRNHQRSRRGNTPLRRHVHTRRHAPTPIRSPHPDTSPLALTLTLPYFPTNESVVIVHIGCRRGCRWDAFSSGADRAARAAQCGNEKARGNS